MGGSVAFEPVAKAYGAVLALSEVTIAVAAGELLALLGPSGSGKTTLLMALAGLEAIDRGDIRIDGRSVQRVPPNRRGLGMVFQRATLFPHMSVADNVAFPLEIRGMPAAERKRRVAHVLDVVRLPDHARRMPSQLSGGQQQRIALARALVYDPPVLLMDEPFSALDRKLRVELQSELKRIQQELGITVIFVTHDQEEALHIADRIAVLESGRLRQVGTPRTVYDDPSSAFIADFIGRMNFIPAIARGDVLLVGDGAQALPRPANAPEGPVRLALRPEAVRLLPGDRKASLSGSVTQVLFSGDSLICTIALDGGCGILATVPADAGAPARGDRVGLRWAPEAMRMFPA